MSKKYSLFIAILFCVFLGGFALVEILLPDRAFSPGENRMLAGRPELSVKALRTGKFMSGFETYVADQFPLRDGWIAGKAWSERLTGKHESNGIYFAQAEDGTACLIPRFDAPDEKRVAEHLDDVKRFAARSPVPVTFSLVPTAASVWVERLPRGAPNYDQRLLMDQAAQTVPDFVNLYGALASHKEESIYYRTDHHWTSLGAYYGYQGLAEALGYEAALPPEFEVVSRNFYGTSCSASGVRWVEPDLISVGVPDEGITVTSYSGEKAEPRQLYDFSKLEERDQYAFFLGGQQPLAVIETQYSDRPRLLIVRDSYADSLAPFLTRHFSEIHLVDLRYYKGSLGEYIREKAIDRVLVLYSAASFVSDSNLARLTFD